MLSTNPNWLWDDQAPAMQDLNVVALALHCFDYHESVPRPEYTRWAMFTTVEQCSREVVTSLVALLHNRGRDITSNNP
jgi:hypothetical protein